MPRDLVKEFHAIDWLIQNHDKAMPEAEWFSHGKNYENHRETIERAISAESELQQKDGLISQYESELSRLQREVAQLAIESIAREKALALLEAEVEWIRKEWRKSCSN